MDKKGTNPNLKSFLSHMVLSGQFFSNLTWSLWHLSQTPAMCADSKSILTLCAYRPQSWNNSEVVKCWVTSWVYHRLRLISCVLFNLPFCFCRCWKGQLDCGKLIDYDNESQRHVASRPARPQVLLETLTDGLLNSLRIRCGGVSIESVFITSQREPKPINYKPAPFLAYSLGQSIVYTTRIVLLIYSTRIVFSCEPYRAWKFIVPEELWRLLLDVILLVWKIWMLLIHKPKHLYPRHNNLSHNPISKNHRNTRSSEALDTFGRNSLRYWPTQREAYRASCPQPTSKFANQRLPQIQDAQNSTTNDATKHLYILQLDKVLLQDCETVCESLPWKYRVEMDGIIAAQCNMQLLQGFSQSFFLGSKVCFHIFARMPIAK